MTILALSLAGASAFAKGKAAQVVVVVWDGMRPDFVTRETTPTLWNLAQEGVRFTHHHPVYVSSTEVNGVTLATGDYPGESGVIGNKEYRPAIDALHKIETQSPAAVRKGDAVTGDHYLGPPTVAEILQREGRRTLVAGAKGVALLADRAPRSEESLGVNVFEGNVLPSSLAKKFAGELGKFPAVTLPKTKRDHWTTRALLGLLWENGVAAFSLLWLSEPDYAQHMTGPGSPTSLAAVKSSDKNLARVLAALDRKQLREQTDIIVVSDHGFSTIDQSVDVAGVLKADGFRACREFPAAGGRDGDIMVVGDGGSVLVYVIGHEPGLVARAVHCLQAQPFCGVVFTQQPVEGAFTLQQARINSATAPDIVVSLRWKPDKSTNGTPGLLCSDLSEYGPGQGMHGSLSPFDMHNICVAAGPDFRKGFLDDLPTGNIDIAPTVLWILGSEPNPKCSGRVLREALVEPAPTTPASERHRLEATYRGETFTWHQYLDFSEVEGVLYFDEGNGGQTPHATAGGR